MRLVLASRSPRRSDLLAAAGYAFSVVPVDVDERITSGESSVAYVSRLARDKATRAAREHPDAVVLGADTVVVVDGDILGKPRDDTHAAAMLRRLSGRAHDVLTGVAVTARRRWRIEVASTRVTFRHLGEADVAWYLSSGESAGKAGGYAIQGRAARFVTGIDGSYSNVVGLPVAVVDRLIRALGAGGAALER